MAWWCQGAIFVMEQHSPHRDKAQNFDALLKPSCAVTCEVDTGVMNTSNDHLRVYSYVSMPQTQIFGLI